MRAVSKVPVRVVVVGVSGFSGAELVRLIDADPRFRLLGAVADRWAGDPLGRWLRLRRASEAASLEVRPTAELRQASEGAEIALLATPAEVSAKLAPELLERGVRVIDLSGAFRLLDAGAYPRWYGFEHPCPHLLAEARYGLPEVPAAAGDAPAAREARLVANPGCYATAAILAAAPLLARGLIERRVFADGKSGVTGAGRKVEERLLFTEVDENLSLYRVGNHQHTPEIEQALSRVAGAPVAVTFTPHLLPIRRGLLVTAYAQLAAGVDPARVPAAISEAYAGAGVVRAVGPGEVSIGQVANTPEALVGAHGDGERSSAVSVAALDNLLKGAASQAMQNLCEMAGEPFWS
jgi:N-acetyl-gamma-glutamyl-phosphate reductase